MVVKQFLCSNSMTIPTALKTLEVDTSESIQEIKKQLRKEILDLKTALKKEEHSTVEDYINQNTLINTNGELSVDFKGKDGDEEFFSFLNRNIYILVILSILLKKTKRL